MKKLIYLEKDVKNMCNIFKMLMIRLLACEAFEIPQVSWWTFLKESGFLQVANKNLVSNECNVDIKMLSGVPLDPLVYFDHITN